MYVNNTLMANFLFCFGIKFFYKALLFWVVSRKINIFSKILVVVLPSFSPHLDVLLEVVIIVAYLCPSLQGPLPKIGTIPTRAPEL